MLRFAAIALLALGCLAAAETKDPNEGVVTDPTTYKVWTTENGTKYHLKTCPNAKIETTVAQSINEGDEPCKQCAPPAYDPAKVVVFTSESGKKYHLFSCRYAKTASNLKEAVAQALEPCGTCKPPALWTPPKKDAAPAK